MKSDNVFLTFLIIIIAVIIILSNYIIIDYKIKSEISSIVRKEILFNEFGKVWWEENFNFIKQATLDSIKQSKEYYNNNSSANTDNTSYVSSTWDYFDKIKKDSYVLWSKDAKYTIIEFSDLECPYCAKFSKSWIIKNLVETSNWQINYIFKHFPLSSHKNSKMESLALECLWSELWEEKFFEFKDLIFTKSKSNWVSFDEDSISKLAESLWADYDSMISCIKDEKFLSKLESDVYDWTLWWVTWTPTIYVFNDETWKYQILPWVYDLKSIEQAIEMVK